MSEFCWPSQLVASNSAHLVPVLPAISAEEPSLRARKFSSRATRGRSKVGGPRWRLTLGRERVDESVESFNVSFEFIFRCIFHYLSVGCSFPRCNALMTRCTEETYEVFGQMKMGPAGSLPAVLHGKKAKIKCAEGDWLVVWNIFYFSICWE